MGETARRPFHIVVIAQAIGVLPFVRLTRPARPPEANSRCASRTTALASASGAGPGQSGDKSVEGAVRAVRLGAAVGFFDRRARLKAGQAFFCEPHHLVADISADIDRVLRKVGFEQFRGETAGPAAELQDRPASLEFEMRRKVIHRGSLIESLRIRASFPTCRRNARLASVKAVAPSLDRNPCPTIPRVPDTAPCGCRMASRRGNRMTAVFAGLARLMLKRPEAGMSR